MWHQISYANHLRLTPQSCLSTGELGLKALCSNLNAPLKITPATFGGVGDNASNSAGKHVPVSLSLCNWVVLVRVNACIKQTLPLAGMQQWRKKEKQESACFHCTCWFFLETEGIRARWVYITHYGTWWTAGHGLGKIWLVGQTGLPGGPRLAHGL